MVIISFIVLLILTKPIFNWLFKRQFDSRSLFYKEIGYLFMGGPIRNSNEDPKKCQKVRIKFGILFFQVLIISYLELIIVSSVIDSIK